MFGDDLSSLVCQTHFCNPTFSQKWVWLTRLPYPHFQALVQLSVS